MDATVGLVQRLKSMVGGPPRLDPAVFKKARPIRHPDARDNPGPNNGIVIVAPLASDNRRTIRWFSKLAKAGSAEKSFELEEIGALVWSMCDGKTAVGTIAKRLQDHYRMNKVEAEVALGRYLETLAQRGLIILLSPKK